MRKPVIIPAETEIRDIETDEVLEVKQTGWTLLPPAPGKCQQCAVDHRPDEPHNQQSLTWQYWFFGTNGRWPTWTDAMAHCSDEVKAHWRRELPKLMASKGIPIPEDLK